MLSELEILKKALSLTPQYDYPCHSRVHHLRTFPKNVYVKREDELGFGITGSKIRKYRTLIPYFKSKGIQEVALIGGAQSNHILGFSQLLIENAIRPFLFLRGAPFQPTQGNHFLLRLLVPKTQIRWIPRDQWSAASEIASQSHSCVIPEGGMIPEALPGLLTLVIDILINEQIHGEFVHIFVDSGTGLTAIALILGLAWLKKPTIVHVLQLAESSVLFEQKLKSYHDVFEKWLGYPLHLTNNYKLHYPTQAKSFGSTTTATFKQILQNARQEGFLTDPIYSGKLFFEAKKLISSVQGSCLIIHSGGGLSLFGFMPKILSLDSF